MALICFSSVAQYGTASQSVERPNWVLEALIFVDRNDCVADMAELSDGTF